MRRGRPPALKSKIESLTVDHKSLLRKYFVERSRNRTSYILHLSSRNEGYAQEETAGRAREKRIIVVVLGVVEHAESGEVGRAVSSS